RYVHRRLNSNGIARQSSWINQQPVPFDARQLCAGGCTGLRYVIKRDNQLVNAGGNFTMKRKHLQLVALPRKYGSVRSDFEVHDVVDCARRRMFSRNPLWIEQRERSRLNRNRKPRMNY